MASQTVPAGLQQLLSRIPEYLSQGEDLADKYIPRTNGMIRGALGSRSLHASFVSVLHAAKHEITKFNLADAIYTRFMFIESFAISTLEGIWSVFVASVFTIATLVTFGNVKIKRIAMTHAAKAVAAALGSFTSVAGVISPKWGGKVAAKLTEAAMNVAKRIAKKEFANLIQTAERKAPSEMPEIVEAFEGFALQDLQTYDAAFRSFSKLCRLSESNARPQSDVDMDSEAFNHSNGFEGDGSLGNPFA